MSAFAVSGSRTGMGAATAALLRSRGHRVIGIDIADADVTADLSVAEGVPPPSPPCSSSAAACSTASSSARASVPR